MVTKQVLNGQITLYETIKLLPVTRFNLLNKFVAQEQGIGSDLNAVSRHYAKFDSFIAVGNMEALRQERINLQYCFHLMFNDIDLKTRAFLCMVHNINGRLVGDLNDDLEADACIAALDESGCTIGDVEEIYDEIKKKLTAN